jgi:uncharacterized protein
MSIKQHDFSDYIRIAKTPLSQSGTEKIYHRLVRANLQEVLANIYPRLMAQLGEENWMFLLDQFLQSHKARTPYFYQVPDEFLGFLWHNKALYSQWPWLWALAHFEWMELVATVADEVLPRPNSALIRCSPLAYYCQYAYAVYYLDKEYTPLALRTQPWQGIVYRNSAHEVQWFVLDAWSALVFTAIQQQKNNVDDIVHYLKEQASGYPADTVYQSVVAWCNEWRKLEILI